MKTFNIENRRYLGSKTRLLPFIHDVVSKNCPGIHSVLDLFGGIGDVASSFNDGKVAVSVNDLLLSNFISYEAWFGSQKIDSKKMIRIISEFNSIQNPGDNYFSDNFSGTYFSRENCQKIGFIRQDIEDKFQKGEINSRERAILITSLLYAMDRIANTVGHYDAYRMNGDLKKPLIMEPLSLASARINRENHIYREDANSLVKKISADLVYIDPPYNSRQYCDAYHLLENVAEWAKPQVFGVAKKMNRKGLKSGYCTQKAPLVFDDLISNIKAKYILVSYNNMGKKGAGRSQAKISDEDIMASLSKRGEVMVFSKDFNQFTTGKTHIDNHQERLFLCVVGKKTALKDEKDDAVDGFAKSPLNYTGGKYKLLPQLISKMNCGNKTFIDLFGGGFNVGANVPSGTVIYNDKQKEVERLIRLLYVKNSRQIIDTISGIIEKYGLSNTTLNGYEYYSCVSNSGVGSFNKAKYEKLRDDYNSMEGFSEEKDFLLLVLVIYSFNNQIRFNSKGQFNMPVGKRDFNNSTRKNLISFCKKIKTKQVKFCSSDFRHLLDEISDDCFVYCDPPYFLGNAVYNESDGWTKQDEMDLLSFLASLNEKGVKFALSNVVEHKGEVHQDLIDWMVRNRFDVSYINSNYSNSNYHLKDRGDVTKEVLVSN
jgi:adenine-specific DNA-methyltransferase